MMLFSSIAHWFWGLATQVTMQMTQVLLGISFFLAAAFQFGWVHRLLTWAMERELSKILNHTPVTVGSIRVDLLRGKVWARNLILHSPRRQQWKWQSPVQARIGNLYVECNLVLCILSLWFLWEELPLDIKTVEISDVQGFVERKQNVFNFYLMDPHLDVPDPVDVVDDDDEGGGRARRGNRSSDATDADAVDALRSINNQQQQGPQLQQQAASISNTMDMTTILSDSSTTTSTATSNYASMPAAQKLVEDMVRALGRATQQGSLHTALVESRARIKTQLKALQMSSSQSKTEAMQEGVKIVQQVSKSLVEKSQTVHPSVVFPNRRELPHEKIVYGRVGRVVIRDLRVFTRDHHFSEDDDNGDGEDRGPDDDANVNARNNQNNEDAGTSTNNNSSTDISSISGWNKPIWLEKVTFRAAELCPPLSAKDHEQPHLPAVFQPLDRCFEIIWKRVLTEIAKSNTGAFFQTAMGEVFDYWMEQKKGSNKMMESSSSVVMD